MEGMVLELSAEYTLDGELIEVGFAKEFQESVRNSQVIAFNSKALELKILKTQPTEILVVKSTIDSPKKINSVELYSDYMETL